jgi:glutaredoxin
MRHGSSTLPTIRVCGVEGLKRLLQQRCDTANVVFGKPSCGYTRAAMDHLASKGIAFQFIDVDERADLHPLLVSTFGQTTVPYVCVRGMFVGGYTETARAV